MADTYKELALLLERLPKDKQSDVREFLSQAIGYVWGYEDAGGKKDYEEHGGSAYSFGIAFATHVAKFHLFETSYRVSIQDGFAKWRKGKEVGSR